MKIINKFIIIAASIAACGWAKSNYAMGDRTVFTTSGPIVITRPQLGTRLKSGGISSLHRAAARGNIEILDLLLKNGALIDERDFLGRTPLHAAVQNNQPESVLNLINAKASVYAVDLCGQTPLHIAATLPNLNRDIITNLLIFGGITPHIKNCASKSPIDVAMEFNNIMFMQTYRNFKAVKKSYFH